MIMAKIMKLNNKRFSIAMFDDQMGQIKCIPLRFRLELDCWLSKSKRAGAVAPFGKSPGKSTASAGPGPGSLHVPLLGSVESLVPGGRSPRSAASQLMAVDKVNPSEK